MNKQLEEKLKSLPKTPGVYFHKNAAGEIIYIGKAAVLRNRVRQYFQKSRYRDPKTDALVTEIADTDWIEVDSEIDALFLEAEQVRRYLPPYNIMLRDDKSLEYVRIDIKSDYPTVQVVRRPLDDGAEYLGPYMNGYALKRALKYLRRAFPYAVKKPIGQKRASLHYHIGLDPGLEEGRTSLEDYRANLRNLMQYLKGNRVQIMRQLEREMKEAAKQQDFEAAAKIRNQLGALQSLTRQVVFSDREFLDVSKDKALFGLAQLLNLKEPPRRLEGFDISHMQGSDTVASMVVFTNGLPDKTEYRKFKMRIPGNDDFTHMNEVVGRRLGPLNQKKWLLPSIFLIDGGKGQLGAALKARDESGIKRPMIGLAKRFEQIIIAKTDPETSFNQDFLNKIGGFVLQESADYFILQLPEAADIIKLLQRIRDESHRFAVSYHSTLKQKRTTGSILDEIPGVGAVTRKKLIKAFGSARSVMVADEPEIAKIVGLVLARRIISSKMQH